MVTAAGIRSGCVFCFFFCVCVLILFKGRAVELTGLTERLDIGYKEKRGFKNDS